MAYDPRIVLLRDFRDNPATPDAHVLFDPNVNPFSANVLAVTCGQSRLRTSPVWSIPSTLVSSTIAHTASFVTSRLLAIAHAITEHAPSTAVGDPLVRRILRLLLQCLDMWWPVLDALEACAMAMQAGDMKLPPDEAWWHAHRPHPAHAPSIFTSDPACAMFFTNERGVYASTDVAKASARKPVNIYFHAMLFAKRVMRINTRLRAPVNRWYEARNAKECETPPEPTRTRSGRKKRRQTQRQRELERTPSGPVERSVETCASLALEWAVFNDLGVYRGPTSQYPLLDGYRRRAYCGAWRRRDVSAPFMRIRTGHQLAWDGHAYLQHIADAAPLEDCEPLIPKPAHVWKLFAAITGNAPKYLVCSITSWIGVHLRHMRGLADACEGMPDNPFKNEHDLTLAHIKDPSRMRVARSDVLLFAATALAASSAMPIRPTFVHAVMHLIVSCHSGRENVRESRDKLMAAATDPERTFMQALAGAIRAVRDTHAVESDWVMHAEQQIAMRNRFRGARVHPFADMVLTCTPCRRIRSVVCQYKGVRAMDAQRHRVGDKDGFGDVTYSLVTGRVCCWRKTGRLKNVCRNTHVNGYHVMGRFVYHDGVCYIICTKCGVVSDMDPLHVRYGPGGPVCVICAIGL